MPPRFTTTEAAEIARGGMQAALALGAPADWIPAPLALITVRPHAEAEARRIRLMAAEVQMALFAAKRASVRRTLSERVSALLARAKRLEAFEPVQTPWGP